MSPAVLRMIHPVTLGAVALLVVNDHVLKRAHPSWLTGKLSDVAGLAFFPTFLVALTLVLGPTIERRVSATRLTAYACVATALVFALVKTWAPMGDLYSVGLGALQWPFRAARALALGRAWPHLGSVRLVRDPSDLLALPAVLVALWTARVTPRRPARLRQLLASPS